MGMVEHDRSIPPWHFIPLLSGDARFVFVYDLVQSEMRVGDILVLAMDGTERTLRRRITHLYNGPELSHQDMVCVSVEPLTISTDDPLPAG